MRERERKKNDFCENPLMQQRNDGRRPSGAHRGVINFERCKMYIHTYLGAYNYSKKNSRAASSNVKFIIYIFNQTKQKSKLQKKYVS